MLHDFPLFLPLPATLGISLPPPSSPASRTPPAPFSPGLPPPCPPPPPKTADTREESLSECSDSISSDSFSIYTKSSSSDSMQTSSEIVIFAGKAYLKINLLVKTPLLEFMAVSRSQTPANPSYVVQTNYIFCASRFFSEHQVKTCLKNTSLRKCRSSY